MSYPANRYGNQGKRSSETKAQERQAQASKFAGNGKRKAGKT